MEMNIRPMQDEDIKQVQDIAKTTWYATYKGIIPVEVQNNFLKTAYSDENMKRRLERSFLYVAEVEGKVVGFANYSPIRDGGKVELAAIYLYPQLQGLGIGTALLQQAIIDLEGIKEIYINVEKENHIGKAFYEAKGFKIVEEFDDLFDGHTLKTVRMVMKI
ncbi:GNAT family N-acetyltransferase [Ureibacillus sinduriensis]|uniref:GNAT family acetyltransferase n=1 Tax=Ureibacillus sinduriensis BLB-1 = JCM 15800 TaxID=1384057 RepID=A0A0A3HWK1_9BACL|nr:GNAT family N-acetyltransferase [Ureibacillus sinduriensis]KGR76986.1 GNAT family acetyltransferase [Ureibacillus sinduriensis BLB-1 = JCM 15800]